MLTYQYGRNTSLNHPKLRFFTYLREASWRTVTSTGPFGGRPESYSADRRPFRTTANSRCQRV